MVPYQAGVCAAESSLWYRAKQVCVCAAKGSLSYRQILCYSVGGFFTQEIPNGRLCHLRDTKRSSVSFKWYQKKKQLSVSLKELLHVALSCDTRVKSYSVWD